MYVSRTGCEYRIIVIVALEDKGRAHRETFWHSCLGSRFRRCYLPGPPASRTEGGAFFPSPLSLDLSVVRQVGAARPTWPDATGLVWEMLQGRPRNDREMELTGPLPVQIQIIISPTERKFGHR